MRLEAMRGQRIAVAMSGGLDSTVAAALLVDAGAEVFGLSAKTWPGGSRCCSDEDIRSAQRMADALGIPHFVIDLQDAFDRHVVDYFADEYARGRTPSPCAVCNRYIKFGALQDRAIALGADRMATGHYARIADTDDGHALLRGRDDRKDQSYFLFDLSQARLAKTAFPVGNMHKHDAYAYARTHKLPVADRSESQDLCFVTAGDHWQLTEQRRPAVRRPGDIVDADGNVLGHHEGIHRFTVGQRKGIGIAAGQPMYVLRLDSDRNQVVVAPREALLTRTLDVHDVRWTSGPVGEDPFAADVKVRYAQQAAPATVHPDTATAHVTFADAQFAVTPGQAAVFYRGDTVVGGGWIG